MGSGGFRPIFAASLLLVLLGKDSFFSTIFLLLCSDSALEICCMYSCASSWVHLFGFLSSVPSVVCRQTHFAHKWRNQWLSLCWAIDHLLFVRIRFSVLESICISQTKKGQKESSFDGFLLLCFLAFLKLNEHIQGHVSSFSRDRAAIAFFFLIRDPSLLLYLLLSGRWALSVCCCWTARFAIMESSGGPSWIAREFKRDKCLVLY